MIKLIPSTELKVGMYIHDLAADWSAHPFLRSAFALSNDKDLETILACGIREVYIDSERGLDVADAPTKQEVQSALQAQMLAMAEESRPLPARTSLGEEMGRARAIKQQATTMVRSVMQDVRLGKAVALDRVEPVVSGITESILRNSGALVGLMHIKNKDDYTFLHSVSVCTFMVAFCRSMGMDETTTHQAGLGGLLHDTGKARVPDAILNKPGRLTDEEFAVVKCHPRDGYDILASMPGIGAIPLDITLHHHERVDGSGYPNQLAGEQISTLAKMAAIVDVYDAITADRVYHKGLAPTDALRKMFEWSKHHFDPLLVKAFMRCVGIYPVGTLVMLESSRLAIVTEHNEASLLQPKVKVIFDVKKGYQSPSELDLAKPDVADRIVSHESPRKWKIDTQRFL